VTLRARTVDAIVVFVLILYLVVHAVMTAAALLLQGMNVAGHVAENCAHLVPT
jgi:hypothetical protein